MKTRSRGFTLIELLTVIAIIGILAAIIIPTVGRVRESAKRAKCMSNVRQITMGLINSANQNKGQLFPRNAPLPADPNSVCSGEWAWDVNHTLANQIINTAGREVLYCPSSRMLTDNDPERMWEFANANSINAFAVTGYVLLVDGTKQINSDYLNDKIRADYPFPRTGAATSYTTASRRPLVVDAVISASTSDDSFANAGGGLPVNVSNHMEGTKPMGAHTGFVDGHITWRTFKKATIHDPSGFGLKSDGSTPKFWF